MSHQQQASSSQYHPSTPDQWLLQHPPYCTWSTAEKLNIKKRLLLLLLKWIKRKLHKLFWKQGSGSQPYLSSGDKHSLKWGFQWTRHSLCLFFSLLPHTRPTGRTKGQKGLYTQWPTTYTQYTFNYPGIFVSQVLLHNPVFTFGSLWIQIKCLTMSKSILCQFKSQITLLVSCRIRCGR